MQQSTGLALLIAGAAFLLTLWLIPIGLPLMLIGVALISAPSEEEVLQ
jgi:hypothetical protein